MKKYIAECFGTFLLVTISLGTAVFAGPDVGILGVAAAFGIALMLCVVIIGPISGSHVNPAVSIAMALRKKLSWKDFGFYVLAQFIGALLGGTLLFVITRIMGDTGSANLGYNFFNGDNSLFDSASTGVAIIGGLLVEIIFTFIFIFIIFGVTSKSQNKWVAPVAIGFALMAVHLVTIPLTNTSVNPARSFGVAVFGGRVALEQIWLFLVAPMVGGVLAAVAAKFFFKEDKEEASVTKVKGE